MSDVLLLETDSRWTSFWKLPNLDSKEDSYEIYFVKNGYLSHWLIAGHKSVWVKYLKNMTGMGCAPDHYVTVDGRKIKLERKIESH